MNNKFLMYMMTGNIMFLFLPTQMAMMMMLMGVNFGGASSTAGSGALQTSLTSGSSNMLIPLMLMNSTRKSYPRRRTRVIYRRARRY